MASPESAAHPNYKVVIEPPSGFRLLDFRELHEYRDLFAHLVYRLIRGRYAQSALGFGWAVIPPLATTIVFSIVFGRIVRVSFGEGIPYAAAVLCGIVPWNYFSTSLSGSINALNADKAMLSKIYFPRVILPLANVLANLVDFVVSLMLLFCLLAYFQIMPNAGVVVIPLLMLITMLASSGLGMGLSALAVQYRDVGYGMGFAVRMLMYAAPVIYPLSSVPEKYIYIYALNPMVGVIHGFRAGLLGIGPMRWDLIAISAAVSVALFIAGVIFFRSKERIFADVA